MSCCRSRRTSTPRPSGRAASGAGTNAPEPPGAAVRLRFLGQETVQIRGTTSGQVYRVTPTEPLLSVDPRDVRVLLRSGLFRAATPT